VKGEFPRKTGKENAFKTFGRHVLDFSWTWASPLEFWTASAIVGRESMPKQTYPKYLDGTSNANASSRVDVMFRVHEVCSQSNGLQAGSASTKRWSNMWNEGTRMAKIAASIHLWVQVILGSHACVLCMCVEHADRLFSASTSNLVRRKYRSIRLSLKKKLRLWGQGELGLMQAMERGFRGVFCSVGLDEIFWLAKISEKWSNSRTCCWREAEVCQIGREKAYFLRKVHTESLQHHVWYFGDLFSVGANVICKRFLISWIMGCFGSVVVCWSGDKLLLCVCLRVFERRQVHRWRATALACVCVSLSMHTCIMPTHACCCLVHVNKSNTRKP
jgi:hypothetical protein